MDKLHSHQRVETKYSNFAINSDIEDTGNTLIIVPTDL